MNCKKTVMTFKKANITPTLGSNEGSAMSEKVLYRISIIDMFCVLWFLLHIMLLYLCYILYFFIIVHA
jgi:hypothetical protein